MAPDTWVYVAMAGVFVLHLAAIAYMRYRGVSGLSDGPDRTMIGRAAAPGQSETDRDRTTDETEEARDGSVACPVCGVTNDPGFSYCWNCITELPANGFPVGSAVDS